MKQFCIIILLVLGIITGNSCKKQPENTPGQRTKTISAKINGVAWQNHSCTTCIGGGGGIIALYESNRLTINGQQDKLYIAVQVDQLTSEGTYKFTAYSSAKTYGSYVNTAESAANGDNNYYYTNDNITGSITITKLDIANKTIQGNFYFDAENKFIAGQIIHITEGNFNIYY